MKNSSQKEMTSRDESFFICNIAAFFAFTKYREVKYDARKISRLVLLHFHVKICCIHEMVSFIVRIYECLLKS